MFFGKRYVLSAIFVALPSGLFVRRIVFILFFLICFAIIGACLPAEAEIKMQPSGFWDFRIVL